jgi:hypothetical protein
MKALEQRLIKLEHWARVSVATEHFISVLRSPPGLRDDALNTWLAEQCRCNCSPDCPGKGVGMVVSEPLSPEAWVMEAHRWIRERSEAV